MIASEDDARLLLNKWREDRSVLMVFLALDERFGANFPCTVESVSLDELGMLRDVSLFRLALRGATFEYANAKDFPLLRGYRGEMPIESSLVCRFPGGFMCAFFEIKSSES